MTASIEILSRSGYAEAIDGLADVLSDCVEGGASVNFVAPYPPDMARRFWDGITPAVDAGDIIVAVARIDGRIVGTAQLQLITKPNQPHRAEIGKMLVHRAARRQGLARALLTRLEGEATARGRWLLVLDTKEGSAAHALYKSLGWSEVGAIPDFALTGDGKEYCAAMFFYKRLAV